MAVAHPTEEEIVAVGSQIAARLPRPPRGVAALVNRRGMALAAADPMTRAALLRTVEVAPACRTRRDLAAHLAAFIDEIPEPPDVLRAAQLASRTGIGRAVVGCAAQAAVRHTAHRFIAGEDIQAASSVILSLWRRGVETSIDLLGETSLTAEEADRYTARCHTALDQLAELRQSKARGIAAPRDGFGEIPLANLSVKVSALTPLLRAQAPELGHSDAEHRLRELLAHASTTGTHLHVDMESLDSREATTSLVLELLEDPAFARGPSVGLVLQAYLRDAPLVCDRLIGAAGALSGRAQPLVVRLVKGAYWDHEVAEARQNGWQSPVFEDKAESDRCFEQLSHRLLAARAAGVPIRPAIASHNLRSIAHAVATCRALSLRDADLELQVLRGLGNELQDALRATGLRVRTYCPVGDIVAGMAYLVRRLLENSSNEGFLYAQAAGAPIAELLRAP